MLELCEIVSIELEKSTLKSIYSAYKILSCIGWLLKRGDWRSYQKLLKAKPQLNPDLNIIHLSLKCDK